VTFLIPIFAFIWGYLVLDEVVTLRMWGATAIIVVGMSFVLRILKIEKN
jgi:drug/metabolite transporter (DMT)-like permease